MNTDWLTTRKRTPHTYIYFIYCCLSGTVPDGFILQTDPTKGGVLIQQDLITRAAKLNREHRRRRGWYRFTSVLASIVVFCTVYSLILPAITLEKETVCGYEEHVHSDSCYTISVSPAWAEYACAFAAHTHSDSCYNADGVLICKEADWFIHDHDDSCRSDDGTLICALPEILPHKHDDGCRELVITYTCGLEESEGHAHSETCYEQVKTLHCTTEEDAGHRHGDECRTLSCITPETEGHTHGAECRSLTCTMAEAEGHTHGSECLALSCTTAESEGHTHSDACRQLTCTEEHEHSDSCLTVVCGLEETEGHAHGDSCYTVTCTTAETEGHAHTDLCYSTVCTIEENEGHTHGDNCYTVTCTTPESEGHTHGDECYTVAQGELICTAEESEGHTHGQACGMTETDTLVCTEPEIIAHTHTEACADGSCDMLQILQHQHDDSCFIIHEAVEESVLSCGLEEHTHAEGCYADDENVSADTAVGGYICGIDEHSHSETCYLEDGTLMCTMPEHVHEPTCFPPSDEPGYICGLEEHTHTDSCSDKTGAVICTTAEHSHTEACLTPVEEAEDVSDPTADVETAAQWERTLPGTLSGDWANDVLAVAVSQLGYTESTENFIVGDDGIKDGYTRYGDWYGDSYGEWCAMFVSFCLHYAEVDEDVFPQESSCSRWVALLDVTEDESAALAEGEAQPADLYKTAEEHSPKPGDVVFFDIDPIIAGERRSADHVGIVAEVIPATETEAAKLVTIEGNKTHTVSYFTYELADTVILGYGVVPENPELVEDEPEEPVYSCGLDEHSHSETCYDETGTVICTIAEHSHTEGCVAEPEPEPIIVEFSEPFTYEDEWISMTVTVTGSVSLPNTAEDAVPSAEDGAPPTPQMIVTPIAEDDPLYDGFTAYELVGGDPDNSAVLTALQLTFTYNGQNLDVSECEVTAEITLSEQTLMLNQRSTYSLARTTAAPEAETGLEVSVLQSTDGEVTAADSIFLAEGQTDAAVMSVPVAANGVLAVKASTAANPSFTVQYYAWIDRVVMGDTKVDNTYLGVIDTNNGGNNEGGNLPTNDNTFDYTYINVGSDGHITTQSELTQVYSNRSCEYITSPNLNYFNSLYENGNYTIKEVWILNDGADPDSTSASDWTVYTDPANLHFTNRAESAGADRILIEDGAVIRLVFDVTDSSYTNAAAFYDYDISDGKYYKAANTTGGTYSSQPTSTTTKVYSYTVEQGINSSSNYDGSGSKLAFGNKNTATGLGNELWNTNKLNQYNNINSNGKGCTFELVDGLDGNGNIIYADGVVAPNLFNDGAAAGKETYSGSLSFKRHGDTYILSSAQGSGGVSASNLDKFNHPTCGTTTHSHIMTNNFWPMDGVDRTGHDVRFGAYGTTSYRLIMNYATSSGMIYGFPVSDDGLDHNSYFGMQYTVRFTLTEDYIGPLEYLFFGDDDMWVFLDGQLVCDIGGVHSSVGEYVNLWDYIEKGSSGTHTLSFFYTERGASGSSCYMQFTLPSVSSITPEQNTGTLRVEKEVVATDGVQYEDTEFQFKIHFTDANGNWLPDDYSYTRYSADGSVIETDIIIYDGGTFRLKDGEYVIIKYLPIGTKYYISETGMTGYVTSVSVNGTITASAEAQGTIKRQTTDIVRYINTTTYVLPNTGGAGTKLYTTGGLLLMAAPLLYGCVMRRKRERRGTG